MSAPNKDLASVILALHAKFDDNLVKALPTQVGLLGRAETKARGVNEVAEALRAAQGLSTTQAQVIDIFDEIFADLIASIYLAGLALDKPARMLLRRALELGKLCTSSASAA